jgi:IS1 family transposase
MVARACKKGGPSVWISDNTSTDCFEQDELHWFVGGRQSCEHGVNTYVMTTISRTPRQIVSFVASNALSLENLQAMTDSAPSADRYCTDGWRGYQGVVYGGKHYRNPHNKNDTHNIESTNADLRHYIAGLRRKSRCFFRTMQTLQAVLLVFINAYNRFGHAKHKYRLARPHLLLKDYFEYPFSHSDFVQLA